MYNLRSDKKKQQKHTHTIKVAQTNPHRWGLKLKLKLK